MIRTYRQYVLWHPEQQIVIPFTNSDTIDGVWEQLPEARSWEPKQVQELYESQGWTVVSAIVSVQVED